MKTRFPYDVSTVGPCLDLDGLAVAEIADALNVVASETGAGFRGDGSFTGSADGVTCSLSFSFRDARIRDRCSARFAEAGYALHPEARKEATPLEQFDAERDTASNDLPGPAR